MNGQGQAEGPYQGTQLSEKQEMIRSVAAVFLILGLLTLFILEMVVGAPVTTTMLSVIVGLILVLFGIDDAHWILFRGGMSEPRGEPLKLQPQEHARPPYYTHGTDDYEGGPQYQHQPDPELERDDEEEPIRDTRERPYEEYSEGDEYHRDDDYDAEADGGREQW